MDTPCDDVGLWGLHNRGVAWPYWRCRARVRAWSSPVHRSGEAIVSDSMGMTRRGFARSAGAVTAGLGLGSLMDASRAGAATAQNRAAASPGLGLGSSAGSEQQQIAAIARDAMVKYHLKALIVRVTTDGEDTYTGALGESMTGVPASPAMHVRNGFIAYR
jgi:hypothetical protein